jgi:hypothetical protein
MWKIGIFVVAVAVVIHRTDVLWCSGRALPLFSAWRDAGFNVKMMPDLVGRTVVVQ